MVHDGGFRFHGAVADRGSSHDPLAGVFRVVARTGQLPAAGLHGTGAGGPVLDRGQLAGRNSRRRARNEAAGGAAAALSLRTLRARALGVVRVPGRLCPAHGIVMGDILRRLEAVAGRDRRRPGQKLHRSKPRIRAVPVHHGAADPVIGRERPSRVDLCLRGRHAGLLSRHAICRDLADGIHLLPDPVDLVCRQISEPETCDLFPAVCGRRRVRSSALIALSA